MKDADDPGPPSQLREDAKWIKKVIEEEQMKPLEVNIHTYIHIYIHFYVVIYIRTYVCFSGNKRFRIRI